MQFGTYVINDPKLTLLERIRLIKDTGFDFVCLTINQIDNEDRKDVVAEIVDKLGLEIDNVHLYGKGAHNIWTEGSYGDEVTERYCKQIQLCSEKGIDTGVVHVTWGIDSPPPVSNIGLDRFKRIAECAEKKQFYIAVENSVSPQHLRVVLDQIDSEYVGFCFDSGHYNCFAPNENFLMDYGSRLIAMHLNDNDGLHDLHMIPFDGSASWSEVLNGLRQTLLGKKKIIFEAKGKIQKICPGKSSSDISKELEHISIFKDRSLVRITDGMFEIYGGLTYEEYLLRLYNAALTISNKLTN